MMGRMTFQRSLERRGKIIGYNPGPGMSREKIRPEPYDGVPIAPAHETTGDDRRPGEPRPDPAAALRPPAAGAGRPGAAAHRPLPAGRAAERVRAGRPAGVAGRQRVAPPGRAAAGRAGPGREARPIRRLQPAPGRVPPR